MWEVELKGNWQKYDKTIGLALVEAKKRGASEYRFEYHGHPMVVDFRTMTQTNVRSGKSRPVRDTSSHHGGGGGGVKVHGDGGIYVHETPSAPGPAAPASMPMPEKEDEKKPEAAKSGGGPGFVSGMAAGVVAAGAAAVGIGLATGAITTDDIGDAAADVGDAMAGVADDVGDALLGAAEDVADFVS